MALPPKIRNIDKQRREKRERLARVRVLLADRDNRTATLVHRILFSFGFRRIDLVTSGEEALAHLRENQYDLIITEWNMSPIDGVTLVKEIRTARADKRIRRDIPIIMLTALADRDHVEAARDAGITEYIIKPFTARTMSHRIIAVIDNPRSFVEAGDYVGPCRRRRELPSGQGIERRVLEPTYVMPLNDALRQRLGSAVEILTEEAVQEAQIELMKAEAEFVEWARDDIGKLESAYALLRQRPGDKLGHQQLLDAAYSIKAQAGIFGYDLGTGVGSMLVHYLTTNTDLRDERLTVVGKHIDAIVVIFTQQIKDSGQAIGQELVNSLRALTRKLG